MMNLRTLRIWGGKVGDDYAWELDFLYKYRDFSDGIDFFEFKCGLDKYPCDHNPKFDFSLRILNVTILEFSIYNIWHMDNEHSPYYSIHLQEEEDERREREETFNSSNKVWDHCRMEYEDGPDYEKDNHD